MGNRFLGKIYSDVYGNCFDKSVFEKRMLIQKAVFLMQELGVSAGDYDFIWYKHGPYCQKLQNDILEYDESESSAIRFSEDAKSVIETVKELANVATRCRDYDMASWMECLASIHYLRKYVCGVNSGERAVIDLLVLKKPHLKSVELNKKAYDLLSERFSYSNG